LVQFADTAAHLPRDRTQGIARTPKLGNSGDIDNDTGPSQLLALSAGSYESRTNSVVDQFALELRAYIRDRIAKGVPIRFDDYMAHIKSDHSPVEDVGLLGNKRGSRPSSSRT
jgi:hypothetical protein